MARPVSGLWGALSRWAVRVDLGRKLAVALAGAALASGIATYAALTGAGPLARDPRLVLLLLNADLVLLLALGALVARRLVRVWVERRRGLAGSGLHSRLVLLFSLVAVAPTIIVTIFAALFLNFGIHSWFSDKVRTAVNESLVVARAYLDEHQQAVRYEALAMANDINRAFARLIDDPAGFDRVLSAQAAFRNLAEAVVFTPDGQLLAHSMFSFGIQFENPAPEWAMEQAQPGEVVILTSGREDRVRALVRLDVFPNAFLLVSRLVEPLVLAHTQRAEEAVKAYQQTEIEAAGMQITSVLLFAVVALLLLLAAIWTGLTFATSLARPISHLIAMAERVRAGDLAARVVEGPSDDELATLGRAFNRMTDQVEAQRSELIEANRQLDARRRFTEAVLAGVSAGVIGLDDEGRVHLPNRHASTLLGVELEAFIGKHLDEAVPEMAELVGAARRRPERLVETQISVTREGRSRTFIVRLAAERRGEDATGFVLTFDDVTELLTAQRQAAWADVARRSAHEIKNPLTPIQLS
ncbi:MAG: HAMP domain-containing protein, partial [Proteobacteria bacterium]|nr:HAMP domain-containing protein [Pseudomonadota bacterium]